MGGVTHHHGYQYVRNEADVQPSLETLYLGLDGDINK